MRELRLFHGLLRLILNPTKRLEGKVALITGAGRGIGLAVAQAFAREGAKLAICARTKSEINAAATSLRKLGAVCVAEEADVSKRPDVKRFVETVINRFGTVDILVNNAGVLGEMKPLHESSAVQWEEALRINVHGVFYIVKEVVPLMIKRGGGSIINVTSNVGRRGRGKWGAYSVSKFALEGFTHVLAEELEDFQIRVNAINPGKTRTAMRAAAHPAEDPLTVPLAEEKVEGFLFLAGDASRGITGRSLEAEDFDQITRR